MYSSRTDSLSSYQSLGKSRLSYLTDEELVKAVEDLKKDIKLINTENEILQKTMNRLDPSLMQGVYEAMEYIKKAMQSDTQEDVGIGSFGKSSSKFGLAESLFGTTKYFSKPSKMFTNQSRIFTSASRYSNRAWMDSSGKVCGSMISGTGPRINVNERLELVAIAIDGLDVALYNSKNDGKKQHALLKAKFEEIENRIENIEKTSVKFEHEVIIDGWDLQTHRIPAEIWIRFMSESTRFSDNLIARFRLRTSTLNIQSRKMKEIIKNNAELHENIEPVDFEIMKIDNSECLKLIEYKTLQLDKLRMITGDAHLALTLHKQSLLLKHIYLDKVLSLKSRRELQTKHMDEEIESIKLHVDNLERRIDAIQKVRMEYHVPNVMDYVTAKIESSDLKNAIKRLETKLQIKKQALAGTNKQLKIIVSQRAMC